MRRDETENLPILRLWGRLLVTLQGEISDDLAERLTEELLSTIDSQGAEGLVLDLTGVWTMDSHLCAALSRVARSAGLMGTPTIISGLSPEIAQTLQMMGIELDIQTALSVELAMERLGVSVKLTSPESPLERVDRNPFVRATPWTVSDAPEEREVRLPSRETND